MTAPVDKDEKSRSDGRSLATRNTANPRHSRLVAAATDSIGQWRRPAGGFDGDYVAVGELPITRAVTQFARAEEMEMHVARLAMLRVLEVMIFQVRKRVAHVPFAAVQRAAVVQALLAASDRAAERDFLKVAVGDQFWSNGTSS